MYVCMVFFRAFDDIAFGFVVVVICMGGDGMMGMGWMGWIGIG